LYPLQWFCRKSSAADAKAVETRLRCTKVEVIAAKFLWLSSRSGWLLLNIHISKTMDILLFYIIAFYIFSFLYPQQEFYRTWLYIWVTNAYGGCLIRSGNCLPLWSTWTHLWFLVGSMLPIFFVFFVVWCFCVLFVFVPCLVWCPVLPVSLDCPFLIAPSVFSNVYCQSDIVLQWILQKGKEKEKTSMQI